MPPPNCAWKKFQLWVREPDLIFGLQFFFSLAARLRVQTSYFRLEVFFRVCWRGIAFFSQRFFFCWNFKTIIKMSKYFFSGGSKLVINKIGNATTTKIDLSPLVSGKVFKEQRGWVLCLLNQLYYHCVHGITGVI